jgi:hypothetical protein
MNREVLKVRLYKIDSIGSIFCLKCGDEVEGFIVNPDERKEKEQCSICKELVGLIPKL